MIRLRIRRHPSAGQLVAFYDKELSGADRAYVFGHLQTCPECRERADDLISGLNRLSSAIPDIPEVLLEHGRQALLRAELGCPLDDRVLRSLFGTKAYRASCKMVEDLVGLGSAPS